MDTQAIKKQMDKKQYLLELVAQANQKIKEAEQLAESIGVSFDFHLGFKTFEFIPESAICDCDDLECKKELHEFNMPEHINYGWVTSNDWC